jgi:hypothetical protein
MCKPGKCSNKMEVTSKSDANGVFTLKGHGTMLGSCGLDCDTGYWEVHLGNNPSGCLIGIKRYSKDINLDNLLVGKEGDTWHLDASDLNLKTDDVIGEYLFFFLSDARLKYH